MTLPYEIVVLDVGGAALVYPWMRAGQADPDQLGGVSRAYAGNQYTSVVAEFMNVPLVSQHRTATEYAAVKTLFAKGAQVPCQGKVFNPVTGVVVCSGKVTGEMEPGNVDASGEPLWTINLTLSEVDNADTADVAPAGLYLTNVVSPLDGSMNLAAADPADDPFSAGVGSKELLNSDVIPTCGDPMAPNPTVSCATVTSSAPEMVWLLGGAAVDGYITGAPSVVLNSIGGTGDRWARQDSFCIIYVVRGGVDVATWVTGSSGTNGGFAGDAITMTAPAVIFPGLTGDRVRVELYGVAALHSGYADDGVHQTVSFGNNGGGVHLGRLYLGGDAVLMWPA
jgi:hypothetical protein